MRKRVIDGEIIKGVRGMKPIQFGGKLDWHDMMEL
jgi:hypothetical protein